MGKQSKTKNNHIFETIQPENIQRKKTEKEILYILLKEELQKGMAGYPEAVQIKTRISELLVIEAEGLKVRSGFKENLEKEKASLFHLAREMKKGAECRVERLRIGGQDIDDSDICEKEVHNFFEPLFNGQHGRQQPFEID